VRLALLLAICAVPRVAFAWTETQVESARAIVDVQSDARADVELELDVRVRGGWLEWLEVAGLDEDLALDETATRFVEVHDDGIGERFHPRVRARDDGRVQLRFERRAAPRRGRYRVTLRYATNLAGRATLPTDDGDVRVEWTMPGWRAGLDGVEIALHLPAGASFADDAMGQNNASVERHQESLADGRTRLRWRRVHQPRTVPWRVEAIVPGDRMDASLSRAALPEEEGAPTELSSRAPSPPPASLRRSSIALLLAVFAVLSILLFERRARAAGVVPRPLLPFPLPLRLLLVLGACGAAAQLVGVRWQWLAALAVAALVVVERTPRTLRAARLGAWHDVDEDTIRRARRRVWRARILRPVDAGAPLGLLVLLAATLLLAELPASEVEGPVNDVHGWLLLLLPFVTGVRAQLPKTPAEKLLALHAAKVEAPTRPALHVDATGRWQDARRRLVTEARPAGLLRLDLAWVGGTLVGLVVTREGSAADAQVARWASEREAARVGAAGRSGRVLSVERALELAAALVPEELPTEDAPTYVDTSARESARRLHA